MVGPGGAIDGVRIVGPVRPITQVELALSDSRVLGLDAPVRNSGNIEGGAPIRLEGPEGSVECAEAAIVAARHVHVGTEDAERLGVMDGDRVTLRVGQGDRAADLHNVLVRSGATHATELHLDVDEAQALAVRSGDTAEIVGRPRRGAIPRVAPPRSPRRLITEREVDRIAREGKTLRPRAGQIVTPSAIDRARALGIWRDA